MRGNRWRYRLDNYLSRGTPAVILALGLISLFVITLVALVLLFFDLHPKDNPTIFDYFWASFIHTYDPAQLASDTDTSWWYRLIIFIACLSGVFILSTLVGVLTTGLQTKLDELRKGKTLVVENNHTLILGWSEEIFSIVKELIVANENHKHSCIVVLAERDKVEMEDELRIKVGSPQRTRIVCRTGSPLEFTDLEIVVPHKARSIIILHPENSNNPDAYIMKVLLALTNNKMVAPVRNIVCAINDEDNRKVAQMIGGNRLSLVASERVIAQIITQTCRQPGLSLVYAELLDFAGDEIYFQPEPQLVGKTYRDAVLGYDNSCVIGLQLDGGGIYLNPPADYMIGQNDAVIAISQDDDTVILSEKKQDIVFEYHISAFEPKQPIPEHVLILGWNKNAPNIIRELNGYVAPGSSVHVVAERLVSEHIMELDSHLENLDCTFVYGNITRRGVLDSLDIPAFDSIILLSYHDIADIQEADSQTLITLVHLRDISARSAKHLSIVSEIRDERNRPLVEIESVHDFIVSEKLVSLLMTQLSENPQLSVIFTDFFDEEGMEIYLKPAEDYVPLNTRVNFATVCESALRRGETAIGFKKADVNGEVVVNPKKSQEIIFASSDAVIVIAEN